MANYTPSRSQRQVPPPAVYRQPYPGRRRRPRPNYLPWLVAALTLLGLAIAPFAVALSAYAYFQMTARIVPGVQVAGMPLGGKTVNEAAAALHKAWNLDRQIQVSDGLHTWQVSPASLGLGIDPGETAQNAYSVAHNQRFLAEADQMATSLTEGWEIHPVIVFDPQAARSGLEALATQASQPPKDATFYIEGAKVIPVPSELGYTFNIEETIARIEDSPRQVLEGGSLRVPLKPVPAQITDVTPAIAEAERLLQTPVVIRAYDAISDETLEFTAPPEEVGTWLRVAAGEQGPQVVLDAEQVTAHLSELSESTGPERWIDAARYGPPLAEAVRQGAAYTLVLNHNPTTYTIQPGDTLLKIGWNLGIPFWMILQANPGMDPEALWAGQQIVVPSKDELLPLPVIPNKRVVISISQQRMWVFENGEQINKFVISTGIDRSPTQPGVFQVQTHDPNAYASVWDLHMPNFIGIYEAWPGFMNGIHGLPTLSNGRRLWANILGEPASYGCIILDLDAAEWLYNWAEEGVVVEIEG